MTRSMAFAVVLLIFGISVVVRLPNLNRPVSKHHEFNVAVVLINIESWRQGGGGSKFHYVPFLNFQHPGDKSIFEPVYTDTTGNRWYLSSGPGWFILPYFIYELFHLPVDPIFIRIVNLLFNLLSVVLLFYFFEQMLPSSVTKRYQMITGGCFLFMFSPGMLWYFGNCYVNTAIMLPFVIASLILLLPMLATADKINHTRLISLASLIVLTVYIDWFIVFICIIAVCIVLPKIKFNKRYRWLLYTIILAVVTGIMLIFFQFASYAGADTVLTYWKQKFLFRSVANSNIPFLKMLAYLLFNMATSYLPLLILIAISFSGLRLKKKIIHFSTKEILFIIFYSCSAFLYNLILLEWSFEHEFSVIPWSILLAWLGVKLAAPFLTGKNVYTLTGIFIIATLFQYYFINRPGRISRDGMAYDSFKIFGEHIKHVPADYKIFSPLEKKAPMIDYYAGRNISTASSYEKAKKYIQKSGISKAVWVEQSHYQFKKIIIIQ